MPSVSGIGQADGIQWPQEVQVAAAPEQQAVQPAAGLDHLAGALGDGEFMLCGVVKIDAVNGR